MKVLFFVIFCASFCIFQAQCWRKYHLGMKVGGLPPPNGPDLAEDEVQVKYFSQHRQNFNLFVMQFWNARYFVNDEFYDPSRKTVFLIIGGAQEAHKKWMKYGPWAESAREHGALLFMLEHRYYGQSQAVAEHTTTNLRFETTHQALEDLARFITGMNAEYDLPSDVKWYGIGGSYGGSLAVWLRQRYPHLLTGAVAISAPLQPVIDYSGYLQVVEDNLALHSQRCVDNLQTAFQQLDALVDNQNYQEIDTLFKLCDSFQDSVSNSKDIGNLYQILSEEFGSVAQFHNVQDIYDITTDSLCDILVDERLSREIQRLANINALILSKNGEECLDYKYDNMVAVYQNTSYTETSTRRQWFHHTCNDFAWYPTSNQTNPVFGSRFPANFFIDLCQDIYNLGKDIVDTGIETIYNRFGGKDTKVTNVIFVHGSRDPWYPLGITETTDPFNKAIFIKGAGHCAALYSESPNDSRDLKAAREEMFDTLRFMIHKEQDKPINTCSAITIYHGLKGLYIVLIVATSILLAVIAILGLKLCKTHRIKNRNSFCSDISNLPEKMQ